MSEESEEIYTPHPEYVVDDKEELTDLNLTDSTDLWLIKLPFSNDLLSDIDGKELSLCLRNEGKLTSFEGSSEKAYDFVSYTAEEPDESVFIRSIEPKYGGKISRRVSVVHYTNPAELEKHNSASVRQNRNSSGVSVTPSSRFFPVQSGTPRSSKSGRTSSKSSKQKSSLSEAVDPLNTPKRKSASKSNISKSPSKSHASGPSHGHSSGVSAVSSDHSHGGKSKKSKHKE